MFWKIKTCFERAPWPLGLTKEWRSDRYFTPHSSISVCCRKKLSGEKSRWTHLPVVSWRAAVRVPWERKHGSALNTSSAVGVCVLRKKKTPNPLTSSSSSRGLGAFSSLPAVWWHLPRAVCQFLLPGKMLWDESPATNTEKYLIVVSSCISPDTHLKCVSNIS